MHVALQTHDTESRERTNLKDPEGFLTIKADHKTLWGRQNYRDF